MTDTHFDVVIAGGGPVGMWLAAELRRGGVRPVVLEKRPSRPPQSKAMTIYPRTLEQFAMRGIADRWTAEGTPVPTSHFAILTSRLELDWLETRFPYTLFLPQRRTEELIAAHLAELGVPVLRGHTVTGLRQDPGSVTLDVDTPEGRAEFRAAYAVGCDGAGSAVRAAAGIEWTGEPPSWTSIMGDVELAGPPPGRAATLARPGGSIFMVDIRDGRWRVATIDHATLDDPPGKPVTFGDLRDSVLRLAGTDFGMRETAGTWLSRVDNESRHAAAYRSGRVLLAGDAAHIHFPAGGQGLNLGLQDATNLAWKLAATIRGWAPPGLLDTYHVERSAVAAEVIADSRAQCALFASPTAEGRALRDRFDTLLAAHRDLRRDLALRLSGLAVRYPASGPGPGDARGSGPDDAESSGPNDAADSLLGARVPDLALRGAPAPTVFGLLRDAKFVLLSLETDPVSFPVPDGYRDRLRVVTARLAADRPLPVGWSGVRAILIRPDGYAAWVLRDDDAPASSPPLAAWLGS
jgi:2-polyprenyl-6-methoxyphenol hydroxylase-like FAD-dependent oxidoreductase